ncbi:MAG: hypothetical protein LBL74_06385 [Bacteroidales bacterium]|nr:hypothetical protein [Bacteroidales bacterium]
MKKRILLLCVVSAAFICLNLQSNTAKAQSKFYVAYGEVSFLEPDDYGYEYEDEDFISNVFEVKCPTTPNLEKSIETQFNKYLKTTPYQKFGDCRVRFLYAREFSTRERAETFRKRRLMWEDDIITFYDFDFNCAK